VIGSGPCQYRARSTGTATASERRSVPAEGLRQPCIASALAGRAEALVCSARSIRRIIAAIARRSIEAQTARAEVHDHDRRLRIPMVKAWNEIRPVVRSILCK